MAQLTHENTSIETKKDLLQSKYKRIRKQTENLCAPLSVEDYLMQPIDDVSPPKWHLAHSTWFFETFILKEFVTEYEEFHPEYSYLFNSYYRAAGDRWSRSKRGDLSRPCVKDIYKFRHTVDDRILSLIRSIPSESFPELEKLLMLGLNHEQQHQELLIYDIKYILASNPMNPVYVEKSESDFRGLPGDYFDYVNYPEGVYDIGHEKDSFAFDNEMPVNKQFLQDYSLRKGLVTNSEYIKFIESGGYEDFKFWLDDGWTWKEANQIASPLYWEKIDGRWMESTLHGMQEINPDLPVTHISFYEAEAFATAAGKRLPTEFEWEIAAGKEGLDLMIGNFAEDKTYHPSVPKKKFNELYQILGDVWEWTHSCYLPYRGYKCAEGALGEYNGKFMINQMVLRGGSCATPRDHIRITYRNFFHPDKRWAFTGIRLAE
ncbi:MAG: ergothioneine biosynthesis protein EgtB [Chitinophagales bacterium]|nr:ergothioneine biosynthesis protein EgtB [Chitinophagales bacterium]